MLIRLNWFRWATLMIALSAASYYGYRATPWSCMDVTVTAYWVQALGSIAAILGAFFLGERQAQKAAENSLHLIETEERKRLASIFAICTAAKTRVDNIRSIFCAKDYLDNVGIRRYANYDHSITKSIINVLGAIPVHEIGSASAAEAILDIRDQLIFTMKSIDALDVAFKERAIHHDNNFVVAQTNVAVHLNVIDKAYLTLQETIGAKS
ncbi:hypothetical protein [Janthinobacterium sp. RB2P8]|uniref:hypothetical protein n=1 Tax=Janthinobacterium sp. RB2P8 TaxID=3424191 RepID=UPI003F23EDCC